MSLGGRSTLWRRCRRTVDRLDLPDPFTAEALIAQLAATRARPIELVPVAARAGLRCGMVVLLAPAGVAFLSSAGMGAQILIAFGDALRIAENSCLIGIARSVAGARSGDRRHVPTIRWPVMAVQVPMVMAPLSVLARPPDGG